MKNKNREIVSELLKVYPFDIEPLLDEIFKPIKNYSEYEVSNYGRVKTLKNGNAKILTPIAMGNYLAVNLHHKGNRKLSLIHRLVAETFIPNPNRLPEVDHKNGMRFNNHVDGLEWVTHSENMRRYRANKRGEFIDSEEKVDLNLVFVQNNQAVTPTLIVAQYFEKRHDNVLQAIEELINAIEYLDNLQNKDVAIAQMFTKSEYIDGKGEVRPMYYLNRDGFTLLAMSFTGTKALKFKLKYIAAFNHMEQLLKNPPAPENKLPIREKYSMLMEIVRLIKDDDALRNKWLEKILELVVVTM